MKDAWSLLPFTGLTDDEEAQLEAIVVDGAKAAEATEDPVTGRSGTPACPYPEHTKRHYAWMAGWGLHEALSRVWPKQGHTKESKRKGG